MKELGANLKIKLVYCRNQQKILDLSISKKYGWSAKTPLDKSFNLVYQSFLVSLKNKDNR